MKPLIEMTTAELGNLQLNLAAQIGIHSGPENDRTRRRLAEVRLEIDRRYDAMTTRRHQKTVDAILASVGMVETGGL